MGVLVCVDIGMRKGEGGICWTFSGECGGELEGVVVGVCVGVGVGMGVRVPMVSETRGGQLVTFCGVNVASGITGMATGGGFWVLVVWSSHTLSWAQTSLDPPGPRSARWSILSFHFRSLCPRTCRHVMRRFLKVW